MNAKRFFLAVLLGFVCSVAFLAEAQDKSGKGGFFEKDFAKNPLEAREPAKPKPSLPSVPGVSQEQLANVEAEAKKMQEQQLEQLRDNPMLKKLFEKDKAEAKQNQADAKHVAPKPVGEEDFTGMTRAIPVNGIGLVVNSLVKEHYEETLSKLISLADMHKLKISTVYTMGDFEITTSSPALPAIVARGGVVRVVNEIPNGYDISLSPTYIVKTAEGEILLEAVPNLDRYFNNQGEFLEPEIRSDQKPKQAPVTPKA
ncbi:MAG: hypothetical protein K1X79_11655 [Oligoflexia bacterium]|nr:hypothetical protein [Oligoflexia bacterium]